MRLELERTPARGPMQRTSRAHATLRCNDGRSCCSVPFSSSRGTRCFSYAAQCRSDRPKQRRSDHNGRRCPCSVDVRRSFGASVLPKVPRTPKPVIVKPSKWAEAVQPQKRKFDRAGSAFAQHPSSIDQSQQRFSCRLLGSIDFRSLAKYTVPHE